MYTKRAGSDTSEAIIRNQAGFTTKRKKRHGNGPMKTATTIDPGIMQLGSRIWNNEPDPSFLAD